MKHLLIIMWTVGFIGCGGTEACEMDVSRTVEHGDTHTYEVYRCDGIKYFWSCSCSPDDCDCRCDAEHFTMPAPTPLNTTTLRDAVFQQAACTIPPPY